MADVWETFAPALAKVAGAAIASSANSGAAAQAGNAAIQGAQISAEAINQAQQLVTQYGRQAIDLAQQRAQEADAIAREAEAEARRMVEQYGEQAAAVAIQRANEARKAVSDANDLVQGIYGQIRAETAPGTNYLRQVVAEDGGLTPAQRTQLDDLRTQTASAIRGSDYAGSGRTAAALFKKVETDYVNDALDRNRQMQLAAAGQLASGNLNAGGAAAQAQGQTGRDMSGIITNEGNQEAGIIKGIGDSSSSIVTNTGNTRANNATQLGQTQVNTLNTMGTNNANLATKAGQVQGDAVAKAGLYDAQAGIANASLTGKAFGDVASTIANEQRESRYADRLSKIEKSLGMN